MVGEILLTASLMLLMSVLRAAAWGLELGSSCLGWHFRRSRWSWSECVTSVSDVWLVFSTLVASVTD